jgi:hypothetical protein
VDVNPCPLAGQPTSCPGMIQVDMGQEYIADVGCLVAMRIQATYESGDGRSGTRFDQDGAPRWGMR